MRRAGELIVEEACVCRVCCVDASRHRSPRWRTSNMWQGEVWYTRIQDTSRASKHFSGKRYSRGYTYKQAQESKRCQPRSAQPQVLGAGTIDAYDRAQYAPMHGLPRGDDRPIEVSSASGDPLSDPRPTHGVLRARRARSLSLSLTHARGTGGGSQPAGTARYFLPAVEKSLRFGSPQLFSHPRGGGDPL